MKWRLLREEVEAHIEERTAELMESGIPENEARQQARREVGNPTLLTESSRDVWSWKWLEQLGQDLRYALRQMRASKAFTALAVLSLALGIGANTAIYSFMDAILLRSLPVSDPASLVVMKWRAKGWPSTSSKGFSTSTGGTYNEDSDHQIGSVFPYPALALFQENRDVLASAFSYVAVERFQLTAGEETTAVKGQFVSGSYFAGMGVAPAAGRLLLDSDDQTGAPDVAVVSYGYSVRHFGSFGGAVGQAIRINNTPFTVVGVAPAEFFGAEPGSVPDVYVPMQASVSQMAKTYSLDKNFYWIEVMGRLKPGVSLAQAQAVLGPQFRRFAEDSASSEKERAKLPELSLLGGATGLDSLRHQYSKPLFVLVTVVGLILLIACANIANLLLARAAARRREIAVRLSMGASRGRVIRQLVTESVALASTGGVLGVALAWWGIRVLTLLLGNGRENFTLHAELNWNVLGVTLGLSVFTGLLFGLVPAIQATRVEVMPALKEVRSAGAPRRAFGPASLSRLLVVAQIVFSLLLLVAAGLFTGTLANLHAIQIGFNRENVLLFTINPSAAGYTGDAVHRLYANLREQLSRIPGVRAASLSVRPLPAGGGTLAPATVAGAAPLPPGERGLAGIFTVGPAFFETMQIPMLAGREFNERDAPGAPLVAVVNQRFARLHGVENPVGRLMTLGNNTFEIVGLTGDALFLDLKRDQQAMVYFPMQNARAPGQVTFEVRAAGNPLDHASTVRQIVRQVDSRIAVSDLKTQAAHIDREIAREITLARLCGGFAMLALAIACVGLYGTTAYNVARRTGEIGIRMALGARRRSVLWMVLREVCVLAAVGIAIGVPIALATSHLVDTFLFGMKANDPLTLGGAVAVLLAAMLAAAWVPARRAARIEPMVALRHE